MSWISEFGREWDVPEEILKLVKDGYAEDVSWHNDVCPSFGVVDKGYSDEVVLRIWVDHPDPELRENPVMRFMVQLTPNGQDVTVEIETDDVNEAIREFMKLAEPGT